MQHYDLAIIGSGSGNSVVGPDLDDWQIAIIEESTFGGTCLNVGCIPTKMFVYPADLAEAVRHSARLGVDAHLSGVRWRDIRNRVFGRIDPIVAGGREYRATGSPNTTLIEAHVSFVDAHTLELSSGATITADQIVLATGSRPIVPPVVMATDAPFHTSETIMRLDELPERMAILGGGYIAAEFAHILAAFGVHTTVISRSSPLLRHLDLEIAGRFTELVKDRWDVRLDATVGSIARSGGAVRLDLLDGSTVEADLLLVATGRVPNSDKMNLAAAGVEVRPDGRIRVDCFQRTSAEHIWALGDVCTPHQLKHVANHEARVVAHNLAHPDA
ncbi:MAG: FAD-dependent oxidoreductase, partial [Pseudonocardiales bacterium]